MGSQLEAAFGYLPVCAILTPRQGTSGLQLANYGTAIVDPSTFSASAAGGPYCRA